MAFKIFNMTDLQVSFAAPIPTPVAHRISHQFRTLPWQFPCPQKPQLQPKQTYVTRQSPCLRHVVGTAQSQTPPPQEQPGLPTSLQSNQEPERHLTEHDDECTIAAYIDDFEDNDSIGNSNGMPRNSTAELEAYLNEQNYAQPTRPRPTVIASSHLQTQSVHLGNRVRGVRETQAILDAIHVPIVQSATYTFRSTRDCIDYKAGRYKSFQYGRYGNPTVASVEMKLAALEGTEAAILSSSGMNAVTTMMIALLPPGSHVVTTSDCYRRTRQFVADVLPRMGVSYTVLDAGDMEGLKNVLQSRNVTLYFSELPTNPMMRVVDVNQVVSLCRTHGTMTCLDTTFSTPVNFRPIEFGVDLVLHSVTKYLAGHQDVMCGALAGRRDLIERVRALHFVLGGVVDPNTAYLVDRGMKTLSLRMEQHNRNALAIVKYLSAHPKVARVNHPILSTHPDFAVAKELFRKGYGGMLSFELKGDGNPWSKNTFQATGRFVDHLAIPYIGPSLGGCESIVEQVCLLSFYNNTLKERRGLGIGNGLVRFSCGLENTEDLVSDIDQALTFV